MIVKKRFPFIFIQFILPVLFLVFFSFSSIGQTTDPSLQNSGGQVGAFSVTGYITYTVESPEKKLLDSLKWQEQAILKKEYAGKRIKQILLQRSTGRVMLFTRGGKGLQMDKATAIQEGLIAPDPVIKNEKRSYIPASPVDIYIEKPLLVGINNHVSLTMTETTDSIAVYTGSTATYSGTGNEYDITVTVPGHFIFEVLDSETKRTKYLYHFLAKRTAEDDLQTKPAVQLGIISGLTVTPAVLKKQQEINISNGYSLAGATVYFAGTGFKDIVVVDIYKKLGFAKCYLDLCLPGSVFTFDNVRISDASGKIYTVDGFTIRVIEDSLQMNGPLPDFYELTSYPQFSLGNDLLEFYVKQELVVKKTDSIPPGSQRVFLILKINTDGSVSSSCEGAFSKLSKLEQKCLAIIQNGPKWIPGKFKETDEPMIVVASFTVDVSIAD